MSQNQPTAIVASTVNCKTMADDTLRLTIDIPPYDADKAFTLFGKRGATVAIARLTDEAAKTEMQKKASKGPYGKLAQYLMSHGFFDAPRVREVLQTSNDLKASEVKDLFKANIGGQLNCKFESLTEISPQDVQNWINAYNVVFTIPREFFE